MASKKLLTAYTLFLVFILHGISLSAERNLGKEKAFDDLLQERFKTNATDVLHQTLSETSYTHNYGLEWDARLIITKGKATLKQNIKKTDVMTRHGEGTEIPLERGDVIHVYPDSEAEIRLYDKVYLKLYSNTEIQLVTIEKKDTVFDLHFGYFVGKISRRIDRNSSIKVKTPYTQSKVDRADFAVAYIAKTMASGIAVFDSGSLSVSTMNEKGLSLGLYELKNNQELVFSAELPEKDEEGHLKDDPDYKMKDIDIVPQSITQLKEFVSLQKRARLTAIGMKADWVKYMQGEREKVRNKTLKEGEVLVYAPTIQHEADSSQILKGMDPDELTNMYQ